MKFRKTLVMVLAACLMIGTIAGTAFAAGDPTEGVAKITSGITTNTPAETQKAAETKIFEKAYEFAGRTADGVTFSGEVIVGYEPYTGWAMYGDNWVYYKDGQLQRHWQYINGVWYYFNQYGLMVQNGVAWIENRLYYFDNTGACVLTPGLHEVKGYYYVYENDFANVVYPVESTTYFLLNSNGYIQTGWNYYNGAWYMVDKNTGRCLTNEWYCGEGGYWYYFGADAKMCTGWVTVKGDYKYTDRTYYLDENGVCQWGWLTLDGGKTYYYLNPVNAARVENSWAQIGNAIQGKYWYLFDENGVMQTGWQAVKTGKYVELDPETGEIIANPAQGQQTVKAYEVKWYYLASWGGMVTGDNYINGTWYRFADPSGEMTAIWNGSRWDTNIKDQASNYLVPGQSTKEKSDIPSAVIY